MGNPKLSTYLPILEWLPRYKREWLGSDFFAGVIVAALFIPEAVAYAQIAGMPPETALYGTWIAMILYAIFSTSRQLVVGVSSTIALMSASIISSFYPVGSADFIALSTLLALATGLVMVLAGILKIGRLARFFSKSILVGFVAGLALVIANKQLPKIFGFAGGSGSFWHILYHTATQLPHTNMFALFVGATTILMVLALDRLSKKLPAALIAFAYGIFIFNALNLGAVGVAIVGDIPAGLAPPKMPDINTDLLVLILPGALGMALLTYSEAMGPIHVMSSKHDYKVDDNKELIGIGAGNIGSGIFQGFAIGASLSRTAANDAAHAKTQVSQLITAGIIVLATLFLLPLFHNLPEATLAGIIIAAVARMVRVDELKRLFDLRRLDFYLAMIAFFGVLTFPSILDGLMLAVAVSILALVARISEPRVSVLGRMPGQMVFSDIRDHPQNKTIPGLLIVRPNESMFFANADAISDEILRIAEKADGGVKAVLVSMELTYELDIQSADALVRLCNRLEKKGIPLLMAKANAPTRGMMHHHGLEKTIGTENIYPDIYLAVSAYLKSKVNHHKKA